jgi:DNA-directed RNA polymerase subunit RPC12/RpoP
MTTTLHAEGIMSDSSIMAGSCPNCSKRVYEDIYTLDDCFGLPFKCPHCGALLFVANRSYGRTNQSVVFVLPCPEEAVMNYLPYGTPVAA